MTEDEVRALVERTCAEQGVPVKVTDPLVISRVAVLLGAPKPSPCVDRTR